MSENDILDDVENEDTSSNGMEGGEANEDELQLDDVVDKRIIWQAKDFSIREFTSMKQDGDLKLQPIYQRNYVMDMKMASRLIESILMDVPIPVIYLAEEADGVFSVIDGQQRLTSFISYVEGFLPVSKPFTLRGLKVLTELNKKIFTQLSKEQQNKIRTTTIHTIVIKKESNEDIKFEIFERLNTGSVKLNEDELRNSVYRGKYVELLSRLEEDQTFHAIVNNTRYKNRMRYRGMILRFLAISEKSYLNYKPSMIQFCNKELKDNQEINEDKANEYTARFKKCIELVNSVFGDKSFRRYSVGGESNPNGSWVTSRVNLALFDVQMCGFVNYSKNQIMSKSDDIRETMISLMTHNEDFQNSLYVKTNDKTQVSKRFRIWFDALEKIVGSPSNEKRAFAYEIKRKLFATDPTCQICRQQIMMIDDSEVDHVDPYSLGGKTEESNAQLAHRFCNRKKGNATP